jgi:hypothetical protein
VRSTEGRKANIPGNNPEPASNFFITERGAMCPGADERLLYRVISRIHIAEQPTAESS